MFTNTEKEVVFKGGEFKKSDELRTYPQGGGELREGGCQTSFRNFTFISYT